MQPELLLTPTDWQPRGFTYDLQRFVRSLRRGWRALALAIGLSVGLAFAYLLVTVPLYKASARLLVIHHQGRPLSVANSDPNRTQEGTEDFIPTQAAIVASHVVVKRAIEAVGLENLPTLLAVKQKGRDPLEETIETYLKVTRPSRMANVLQIDHLARSPEEAVRLVEALAASYKDFLKENYPRNSEAVALAERARRELALELEDAERKYEDFRLKNPRLIPDEKGRSLVTSRLEGWDRAVSLSQAREIQLRAQLKLGQRLASDGVGLWAIVHAMNQLGGDPNNGLLAHTVNAAQVNSLDYVRQLAREQQELAERFGPQYSKVQELQERITRIQERVRESRTRYEQVEIRDLLKALEQALQNSETMRAAMDSQFDKSMKLEADSLIETKLRSNLERRRALFNAVVDQLKQAQLASDFNPVAAQVLEPATALPQAVYPRWLLTLGIAFLIGAAGGTGFVTLQNQMHARLRSAQDVREVLGLPVLGQVPQLPPKQMLLAREVGLASHVLPRSSFAEAFKMLRTNLVLLGRQRQLEVLVVTSPHAAEGKTATASNLAISLASAGHKILLVDADLRHPSLDRLYNVPNDQGLTQILQGTRSAAQVVQHSAIDNLALIAAGPAVCNPAELFMTSRLKEFLAEARSGYDMVLLDSSPLLNVTDPCVLAAVADGTVLVLREGVTTHEEGEQALELLKSLDTPLLGAVLNGSELARLAYTDRAGISLEGPVVLPAGSSNGAPRS